MNEPSPPSRRLLTLVVLMVVVWGAVLTLGAYLSSPNPRRALVVFGAFALFIGSWLALLKLSARRGRTKRTWKNNGQP